MGQANQRRAAAREEEGIRQSVDAKCQVRLCDEGGAVLVLVVTPDLIGEARDRFGGLPTALERRIKREQLDLELDEPGVQIEPARCYVWMRTPDGFEDVLKIAAGSDSPEAVAQSVGEAARCRGYGLHAAVVCSGLLAALAQGLGEVEAALRKASDAMPEGPPVAINIDERTTTLVLPCVRDAGGWDRLAALALREFDKACSSKNSIERNHDRFVVVVEQLLVPDGRPFFERAQANHTIRALAAACKPWRWLVHQGHFIAWYGALFAASPVTVTTEGVVHFDVDSDRAEASLKEGVLRLLELWSVVGGELSLDGDLVARSTNTIRVHNYFLETMPELGQALKNGSLKPRDVAARLDGLAPTADIGYDKLRLEPGTLILDRSALGIDCLRIMLHTSRAFPSAQLRDELLDWYESKNPVVIIKKDAAGITWIAEAVEDEGPALERAVERMAIESIRRLETPSWQAMAGKAVNARIDAMQQTLLEKVVTTAGVDLRDVKMTDEVLALLGSGKAGKFAKNGRMGAAIVGGK